MILYLSLITTFSVGVFLYSLKDDFASPKRRTLRGVLYLILGISAGVPMIHLAFFSKSIGGLEAEISYFYWIFGGVSYIAGASIYILRFPEKCFRGIFDIIVNYLVLNIKNKKITLFFNIYIIIRVTVIKSFM